MAERFHPTDKFTGVMIPRWDDKPDGPLMQSMVRCVCGEWWKNHRFADGACPLKEEAKS